MTGSWLILKWMIEGMASLCVGALLITWMIEGNEFVCEKPGQKFFVAFGIASYLALGLASRFCFVLAGFIYACIAIALLRDVTKKRKVRADG
jgi:hypothetical protein